MPIAVEFDGVDFAYQHGQPVLNRLEIDISRGYVGSRTIRSRIVGD